MHAVIGSPEKAKDRITTELDDNRLEVDIKEENKRTVDK